MPPLAESQINVPIHINLKPFFALAEKSVDTVFTSPNYPKDWVEADCSTRYKYYFKRSPLRIAGSGNSFTLGFTGFYKIIGSTRVCAGSTVLSPWTPECRCGFDENPRRVNVGFGTSFNLQPNYLLNLKVVRNEPQPLDKCSVCFWGQDITGAVMSGLSKELDAAKKGMEDSFGKVNLRPYLQQAWNKLSSVYAIPNVGYLSLSPKKLSMQNVNTKNDLLNIDLSITATPSVSFIKKEERETVVPDMGGTSNNGGFSINLEAALQYDSITKIINGYLVNKRFDVSEGIIKKHVIIQQTQVSGGPDNTMVIAVAFTGSHNGTVYFTGKPTYDAVTKKIEMRDFDYDLKTKDLLLKAARWLFDKQIVSEIKKYTSIDMGAYYQKAATGLNDWLNKEWTKGIKGSGSIKEIKLTDVYALENYLLIRSNCTGNLAVNVNEIDLNF